MPLQVFVFGTLKEGFPNFGTNRGFRVPGTYRTRDKLPLYLVGPRKSPWLLNLPGQGHQVMGQVFEVDNDALAAMDRLERIREPDGYRRVELEIEEVASPGIKTLKVFAYLKPPDQLTSIVERVGPLKEYTLEHAALYLRREA